MSIMLAMVAILLAACSTSGEVSVHSAGYQAGLSAGREARHHHRFYFRHASRYEKAAFCIKNAIADIQHRSGPLLNWTVGFEHGCRLGDAAASSMVIAAR